jgi:hypothetical protein
MFVRIFLATLIAFFSCLSPASADVDEKFKKGWEGAFQYIEDTFSEAVFLDTGLQFLPTKYVPYFGQGKKILARAANNLSIKLTPLGIDSSKYIYTEFDTFQLLRVVAALEYGVRHKLPAATRGELLAYSLCPWMQPQCTNEVKEKIYSRRGWKI